MELKDCPVKVGDIVYMNEDNFGLVKIIEISTEEKVITENVNPFWKKKKIVEKGKKTIVKQIWWRPLHDVSNLMHSNRLSVYNDWDEMKKDANLIFSQMEVLNREKEREAKQK